METFKNSLRINEKKNEIDTMRDALSCIANEIQKFEKSENINVGTSRTFAGTKSNVLKCNCKSEHKSKRLLIAKLRLDLKVAYSVIKTMESARIRDTSSLTNQLIFARGECVDLLERYTNNINIISSLHQQNKRLYDNHEELASLIHLAYDKLKRSQYVIIDEPTTLLELKKLLEYYSRCYVDYRNQYDICLQIKQKNRFLNNKISILENNIEAVKEQLKALEYRNLRLKTENNQMRSKYVEPKGMTFNAGTLIENLAKHEFPIDEVCYQDSGDTLPVLCKEFNLGTHLKIVKKLLSDQDALLSDLVMISKEISIR